MQTCGSNGQWGGAIACASPSPFCYQGFCTAIPPSCQAGGAGLTNCGASSEGCCTTLDVPGGTFYRTYTNSGSGPTNEYDPATVSDYRLDKYLVTVGRFRQFVNAWNGGAGYTPSAGSGKHTHVNGGNGLMDPAVGYEPGWVASDDSNIAPTSANLFTNCGTYATWTASAGSHENLPINCVNWYEAYAFCIWDGGFLPSQAESEYARAGGSQQREYPWGSTDPGTNNQYAVYGCLYPNGPTGDAGVGTCTGVASVAPVGTRTLGAGLWGQLDLAGELYQWALDWVSPAFHACVDCVNLTPSSIGRQQGGSSFATNSALATFGGYDSPNSHYGLTGFRCARTPLCTPGSTQCSGSGVQTCGADHQWGSAIACATGSCSGGACTGSTTTGASCQAGGSGLTNCGASSESCCTSTEVPGGTYYRTYTNNGTGPTGEADPATVSGFRLDKYLVTVGRFRQFVSAVLPTDGGTGWTPPAGSGRHTHLNGGLGLVNSGAPADAATSYETGWLTSDNSNLAPTNANLAGCDASYSTWTAAAGSHENLPVNCVNWYESYAFCIWDGGFLPSEAEWEYAAAGGSQQLEYPWGASAPGTACPGAGCSYAIYGWYYPSGSGSYSGVTVNIAPVGTATSGAGLWGQLDMGGEMWEWNLDWLATYVDPCPDCAYLTAATYRIVRGGSFTSPASDLPPSHRGAGAPASRVGYGFGIRCARTP